VAALRHSCTGHELTRPPDTALAVDGMTGDGVRADTAPAGWHGLAPTERFPRGVPMKCIPMQCCAVRISVGVGGARVGSPVVLRPQAAYAADVEEQIVV
jgi:hypothetical protein